jgi:hypothetical protein
VVAFADFIGLFKVSSKSEWPELSSGISLLVYYIMVSSQDSQIYMLVTHKLRILHPYGKNDILLVVMLIIVVRICSFLMFEAYLLSIPHSMRRIPENGLVEVSEKLSNNTLVLLLAPLSSFVLYGEICVQLI